MICLIGFRLIKNISPDTILFIVGIKLDVDKSRKVIKEEAEALATRHGALHMNVSAKTGRNFDKFEERLMNGITEKLGCSLISSSILKEKNKKSS